MLLQPEPLKIECSGKHSDNLNLQKKKEKSEEIAEILGTVLKFPF